MSQEPEFLEAERIPRPGGARGGSARFRTAMLIAIGADVLQWAVLPVFAPGVASPLADGLDVVVAILMCALLGWHWAFLPTFVVELLPFADLVPTWTLAALVAGRSSRRPAPREPSGDDERR